MGILNPSKLYGMINHNLMFSHKNRRKKNRIVVSYLRLKVFPATFVLNQHHTVAGTLDLKISNIEYKSFSNFTWFLENSLEIALLGDEFLVGKGIVLDKDLNIHFLAYYDTTLSLNTLTDIQRKRVSRIIISSELLMHKKISKYIGNIFNTKTEVLSLDALQEKVKYGSNIILGATTHYVDSLDEVIEIPLIKSIF